MMWSPNSITGEVSAFFPFILCTLIVYFCKERDYLVISADLTLTKKRIGCMTEKLLMVEALQVATV